jgi:prepilin-type N-terminal cleavage/methylation domain-containing protein
MMRTVNRGPRRAGFTLIELLIVIAIIAILLTMTVPAVMRIMGFGSRMTARGDMNGLATAHAAFLQDFHVQHIPSRIILRENIAGYGGTALEQKSLAYLQSLFGKRLGTAGPINWSGRADFATNSPGSGAYELLGEECLTFFLGGIPTPNDGSPNGCLGFSTDRANPSATGGSRKGPYFDFKPNRLARTATGFFMYQDPFDSPGGAKAAYYVYLSSGRAGNDYSADSRQGVQPYLMGTGRFMNPTGYQILCAGRDGKFGPGGASWSVTSGYGTGNDGSDDLANFSSAELRMGQQ